MSSSWFLGDCAVLQVDDRCKIFLLSLSSARTASLFRCVPYVRASHFHARRVYAYTVYMYTCTIYMCTRQRVGARSRVRAGANEIGEIRSEERGGCRPSLSDSSSLSHFRPLRTASRLALPRRRVSAAGKTVGGREDNAEVSWRSSVHRA